MTKTILLGISMLCTGCIAVNRSPVMRAPVTSELSKMKVRVVEVDALEFTGSSSSVNTTFNSYQGSINSYNSSPSYYNGTGTSTSVSTINHISRQKHGEFYSILRNELERHGINTLSNNPEVLVTAEVGEPYIIGSHFTKDALAYLATLGSYASHHRGVDVTFRFYNADGELINTIETSYINNYTSVGITILTTMFDPEHMPINAEPIAKAKALRSGSQELIKHLQAYRLP